MSGIWLISYIVLWVLLLIVAIVLISVLRNLGVIYDSLKSFTSLSIPPKLTTGQVLPEVALQTLSGERRSLSDFRGVKTAFFIVSPQCTACHDLLRDWISGIWDPRLLDTTAQHSVIISIGDISATIEMVHQLGLPSSIPVVVTTPMSIASTWGVTGTPVTMITDEQLNLISQVLEGYHVKSKEAEGHKIYQQ